MPRNKKFNTKKTQNQLTNMHKALAAKHLKTRMKEIRLIVTELLFSETVSEKIDQSAQLTKSGVKASLYLDEVVLEIEKHCINKRYKTTKGLATGYCMHVATIGSSQLSRLHTREFSCLRQLHIKSYTPYAAQTGAYWELHFKENTADLFLAFADVIEIVDGFALYSNVLRWVCAKPDYIVKVMYQGNVHFAVVEIKSTDSREDFENSLLNHSVQAKAAMSCFGVSLGFLVTYLCQRNNKYPLETSVDVIEEADYLVAHKDRLTQNYALFLTRTIKDITGRDLSLEYTIERLESVLPADRLMWDSLTQLSELDRLPRVEKCLLN